MGDGTEMTGNYGEDDREMADPNPRAVMGANFPPPATPYEIAEKAVADIYSETAMWLDGAQVDCQATADGIANLLKMIRDARRLADDNRKTEAEPFDKGKAAVQQRYKPLIDKADLAATACKKALEPWLANLALAQDLAAQQAREEAAEKRRIAEEAIRAADAINLEARAKAEALVKEAKKAETAANRAERQTATAGGTIGRAIGLRTFYTAVIADEKAFARHAWSAHRDEMVEFLITLAQRLVDTGQRGIPGVNVIEQKRAV